MAWCPSDVLEIATCSDDASVKLWRLPSDWPALQRRAAESADKVCHPNLRSGATMHTNAKAGLRLL